MYIRICKLSYQTVLNTLNYRNSKGITTRLDSDAHKRQVSSIWGLRATKFGNVGVRLPGVWVSPAKCLWKTPPKGLVYSAVGLGFIVWDTMLGLPGANPRHQTAGWACPWLARSQSARMLSTHAHAHACTHTHMHTNTHMRTHTGINKSLIHTSCLIKHCLIS